MMRQHRFSFSVLKTSFGRVVVVWSSTKNKVVRVFLPLQYDMFRASVFHHSGVDRKPKGIIAKNCRQIESLLDGLAVTFSMDSVDWSMTTLFQHRVLVAENKIPRGMVSTYGRIALRLGKGDAARAVGNALARNPFPLIIPCHRAIRSDGSLGGYAGGIDMKKKLLLFEGVEIDPRGRVLTNKIW